MRSDFTDRMSELLEELATCILERDSHTEVQPPGYSVKALVNASIIFNHVMADKIWEAAKRHTSTPEETLKEGSDSAEFFGKEMSQLVHNVTDINLGNTIKGFIND